MKSIPRDSPDERQHRQQMAQAIIGLQKGEVGSTLDSRTFTLAAGVTTTTLTDPRIGQGKCVFLMPMTANAAAALSGIYWDLPGQGTIVVHHGNTASTDRTYGVSILG